MNFAQKLVEASYREVETGGAFWRLRTVTTQDLILTGSPMLAKLPSVPSGEAGEVEAQVAEALAQQPEALVDFARMRDAIVCASVVGGRESAEEEWGDVRLVLDRADEDVQASPPRVWLESLPQSTRTDLWLTAMALANDDGRLAKALERFRDRPNGAAGA